MDATHPELKTLLDIAPPESAHVHTVFDGDTLRIILKPGGYSLWFSIAWIIALGVWAGVRLAPIAPEGHWLAGILSTCLVVGPPLFLPLLLVFMRETVILTPEGLHAKASGDFDDGIHPWPTIVDLKYDPYSFRGYARTISFHYLPYNFLVGLGSHLNESEARAVVQTIEAYRKLVERS
jgi:hypothetical protein